MCATHVVILLTCLLATDRLFFTVALKGRVMTRFFILQKNFKNRCTESCRIVQIQFKLKLLFETKTITRNSDL
jgi:hypothetical protein